MENKGSDFTHHIKNKLMPLYPGVVSYLAEKHLWLSGYEQRPGPRFKPAPLSQLHTEGHVTALQLRALVCGVGTTASLLHCRQEHGAEDGRQQRSRPRRGVDTMVILRHLKLSHKILSQLHQVHTLSFLPKCFLNSLFCVTWQMSQRKQ